MIDVSTVPVTGTVPLLTVPPGACSLMFCSTAASVIYLGLGTPFTVTNGFPLPGGGTPITMPAGQPTSKGAQIYAFLPGGGTANVAYWLSTSQ
jgi:hypothetical protein